MRILAAAFRVARELAGLFVDDGILAIVILLVLAATALYASTPWFDAPIARALLVGGVAAALLENVCRTARFARNRKERERNGNAMRMAPNEVSTQRKELT